MHRTRQILCAAIVVGSSGKELLVFSQRNRYSSRCNRN